MSLPLLAATPAVELESSFADLRDLRDQIEVTEARGATAALDGRSLATLRAQDARERARLAADLATAPRSDASADAAAMAAMRAALSALPSPETATEASSREASCDEAAVGALAAQGLEALQERVYDCFGRAAREIRFDGETLDRLTVLARLAETTDPARRRRLFLALAPIWRAVNGDDAPSSPYRRLVRLSAARWAAGGSPVAKNLAALGVAPAAAERWLVTILEHWRDTLPSDPAGASGGHEADGGPGAIEPWDVHYRGGALARGLAGRVPLPKLREVTDQLYAALGADPRRLAIHYDLEPRTGKTPVAFTTFGRRPRARAAGWSPGEAWVFATYRTGGIDNLIELLHETGHAIHILAIRARPAFADWPDSDTFTEALGDLVALEAYEPAWQQRWLGASAPLADSLRAKYAGIVLDVAWALFEIRLHRTPDADPNQVWTAITRDYLRVAPHPELSWWALRGQLVDAPGYMTNYAVGAILVADLRQRCRELRGPFDRPDPGAYAWLAERLYRFGLAKPSREVVEAFLGRPLSPDALLADLDRLRAPVASERSPTPAATGPSTQTSRGGGWERKSSIASLRP